MEVEDYEMQNMALQTAHMLNFLSALYYLCYTPQLFIWEVVEDI